MKRFSTAILALAFFLATFAAAEALAKPAPKPAAVKPAKIPALVVPGKPGLLPDMTLGNPNAPVTVVEYASAACPHCADWNTENWAAFEAKYIATGKVRYVFREVLTNPQQYALSAFLIGRCAVARSKNPGDSTPYFTVVKAFFAGQANYFQTQQIGTVMADVTAKTGMTTADMQACVADETTFSAFMTTMRTNMEADGVSSTPTFIINGVNLGRKHEMVDLDAAITAASK